MRRNPLVLAAIACAGVLACAAGVRPRSEVVAQAPALPAPIASASPAPPDPCALDLAAVLRAAVEEARFDEVVDLGPSDDPSCPSGPRCTTAPIARRPSVDVAVIAFAPGCKPTVVPRAL
jgi:hypothetical protein